MKITYRKKIITIIACFIVIMVNVYVKAENNKDKFYFDKTKIEVKAGDEITINLNLYANDMISCSAVVEYSKNLVLQQINYDSAKLREQGLYEFIPQQASSDSEQKENLVGENKRIVFIQARTEDAFGNKNALKGEMQIAELKLKVPESAKKGDRYYIKWLDNPDLTYIGTSKYKDSELEEFVNCEILVTESVSVESDSIKDQIQDQIQNGTQDTSGTEDEKDEKDEKDEEYKNDEDYENDEIIDNKQEEILDKNEETNDEENDEDLVGIENGKENYGTPNTSLPQAGTNSKILVGIVIISIIIIILYKRNKKIQTK